MVGAVARLAAVAVPTKLGVHVNVLDPLVREVLEYVTVIAVDGAAEVVKAATLATGAVAAFIVEPAP